MAARNCLALAADKHLVGLSGFDHTTQKLGIVLCFRCFGVVVGILLAITIHNESEARKYVRQIAMVKVLRKSLSFICSEVECH
jgi:hypothetical protein